MEEARQYPALTTAQWVAVVGYLGFGICALAILVCAFVGQDWIRPIAALACGFGIIQLSGNSTQALRSGQIGGRNRYDRAGRPKTFWGLLVFNLVFAAILAAIAILLLDMTK